MRILIIALAAICIYSCQKEINPSILGTAPGSDTSSVFSLSSTNNSCSHVVPAGTYKKNVPLSSANKIKVDVTVSRAGTWKANTNTVNGISFSGNGQFSTAGNQTIELQGSGLPGQSGTTTFTITAGSSTCKFDLNVDTSASPPPSGNIPPVANAGNDIAITLPTSSVTLKGSGTDADGTISSYLWTQVSGPSTASIGGANQSQTIVNSLVAGTYQFELKVTDNLGATGKDTVAVTVSAAPSSGTLAMQLSLYAVIIPPNAIFSYDGNGKIIKITSNHYPERTITYSNNKIATVDYWYDDGSGKLFDGQTNTFVYDASGNVIKINQTDNIYHKTFLLAEFTYNTDGTMKTKKLYFDSGSTLLNNAFIYTNGNLTGIVENASAPSAGDTTTISYDTRANSFQSVYPQFYFLDIQTDFDQNYRSEMFYFSKNYPVTFGSKPVSVSLTAGLKPFEVMIDNQLWYRYLYN